MKYIIIRFSSLGDCILLSPLVSYLKANGVEEITVVTKECYIELFACMPGVDKVLAIGKRGGMKTLLRMAEVLKKKDAMLIDAHRSLRSMILAWLSKKRGPGIRKYHLEKLNLLLLKRRVIMPGIVERYMKLAQEAGIAAAEESLGGLELKPPPRVEKRVRNMIPNSDLLIAIAPGARWPMKRWPVENYSELAARLINRYGGKIVLLGDEKDTEFTYPIEKRVGNDAVDFSGKTSISETASILKYSSALICNDSGLLHLAEAVGTPVLAVFGPTVREFGYYPILQESKVCERNIPCRPCSRNGSRHCPLGTQECLSEIDVETIEQIFIEMMNGEGERIYRVP